MLPVHLQPESHVPLYIQLRDQLRALVHAGDLRPGDRIPASRELATILGVHRTTVANAYVKQIVGAYLRELEERIGTIGKVVPLRIMVSSGGFTSAKAAAESPILLLESGPAGGVLSALNTARNSGIAEILAFDMGGTTAKACVAVGGEPLIAHSFECARVSRFKRGSGTEVVVDLDV